MYSVRHKATICCILVTYPPPACQAFFEAAFFAIYFHYCDMHRLYGVVQPFFYIACAVLTVQ